MVRVGQTHQKILCILLGNVARQYRHELHMLVMGGKLGDKMRRPHPPAKQMKCKTVQSCYSTIGNPPATKILDRSSSMQSPSQPLAFQSQTKPGARHSHSQTKPGAHQSPTHSCSIPGLSIPGLSSPGFWSSVTDCDERSTRAPWLTVRRGKQGQGAKREKERERDSERA